MSASMLWSSNLLAYSVQVLALVAVGAVLPWLLRVHQPRAQLVWFRLLLAVCLLLPLVQPWRRPVVVMTQPAPVIRTAEAPSLPPAPASPRFRWEEAALAVVGAGAALRMLWLLVGMWRLHRLRAGATPLDPVPPAIEAARQRVGAAAALAISDSVNGPVTFGVRRPVVLLTSSLLDQPGEAQYGIACHEFLHIRRRDWVYTVCEEFAGALLWFHPALWWLLGQIRLVREQVVDHEVVALSEGREAYVETLLAMGGAPPQPVRESAARQEVPFGIYWLVSRGCNCVCKPNRRYMQMATIVRTSRRAALKTGLAAVAPLMAAPVKQPGETRVLFLVGDYWHNPVMQEHHWRGVLGPTGWRLMFAQSAQFVTPEALKDADLFVVCRYAGPDSLGWAPDRMIEDRPASAPFMTDEQQDAIGANVNRGMGLVATHCSLWNPDRTKFLDLLGVAKPIMHTKVQPAHIHDLNQGHPITQGLQPFDIGDDEIFNAELKPGQSTLLFKTSGEEQKVDALGGWCREEGKGRVVVLLPGHIPTPYMVESYKKIMWRSAHWALRRPIGPEDHIKGSY